MVIIKNKQLPHPMQIKIIGTLRINYFKTVVTKIATTKIIPIPT